ncbi:hypothetical protein BRC62_05200 [Halobacteriales archaeon QH_10_67_13]|nr:MAG: hypothetical protein BRC62_05200 [Halobacteriales archaeon QH_10_67_13]
MGREQLSLGSQTIPKAVLDTLEDELLVLDAGGKIVYANESACSYLDVCPEELCGTPVAELIDGTIPTDEGRRRFRTALETALAGEVADPVEIGHDLPVGKRHGEHKLTPVEDDGRVVGVVVLARDITDRRARERKLERARSSLRQTHQLAAVSGFEFDPESGQFTWASGLAELFGREQTPDTLGDLRDVIHPDDRERLDRLAAIEAGTIDTEFRIVDDDRIRWLQAVAEAVDGGRSVRGAVQDITVRKRRKEQLRHKTSVLAATSDATHGGVLVTDDSGHLLHYDDEFVRLCDYSPKALASGIDALARVIALTVPEQEAVSTVAAVSDTDETRQGRWQLTDGRCLQYYFAPIGREDRRYGRLWGFRDITEEHDREQELRLMRQLQSRALRHNLRNKLTVIEGYASLLATRDESEVADQANAILSAAAELDSLAENAQLVKRLVERDPQPARIDLHATLVEITTAVDDMYDAVEVSLNCPSGASVTAIPQLRTALYNAVENAAQHNDPPAMTVSVVAEPVGDGLDVEVRDNGPGIPDQELVVLEDGQETPIKHGSGLGLWVMKLVAGNSAVEISYETRPDGTTVCFRIPSD